MIYALIIAVACAAGLLYYCRNEIKAAVQAKVLKTEATVASDVRQAADKIDPKP